MMYLTLHPWSLKKRRGRSLTLKRDSFFSCPWHAGLGGLENTRERLLAEYKEIEFAPTNNRRVVGSMPDLALNYDYPISEAGSIHSADVPKIIRVLNGMPMCWPS